MSCSLSLLLSVLLFLPASPLIVRESPTPFAAGQPAHTTLTHTGLLARCRAKLVLPTTGPKYWYFLDLVGEALLSGISYHMIGHYYPLDAVLARDGRTGSESSSFGASLHRFVGYLYPVKGTDMAELA